MNEKEGFVKLKMPTYYIAKYSYEDLRAAVLAEREACAQLCDEKALYFQYDFIAPYDVADSCAEEIRARGGEMKDGIALESIAHPEGDPVPDDHEINPDSLETVELEIPINERIKEATPQEISDIGQEAHTDHPMRHWDRTCPACVAEAEKQEPVCAKDPHLCWSVRCQLGKICKNTAPPKRPVKSYTGGVPWYATDAPKHEWVGLTDEEIDVAKDVSPPNLGGEYYREDVEKIARAIEQRLREKNGG